MSRSLTDPMPDNANGAWDLIVAPWHLDEHIPDFPVPVGTVATIGPPLPDGTVSGRVNVLHREVADVVAEAARPLVLSGDCPVAIAVAAASIACAWLPGQVSKPPAREAIARLAGALGTRLIWPHGIGQTGQLYSRGPRG